MTVSELSFEDIVVIADEVCTATGARIRSYAVLAALAAATDPVLRGVPVHSNPTEQIRLLDDMVTRLRPLTAANATFAATLRDVLSELSSLR